MEIRNLITFTKVAEAQSLSKAAKLLGYAQSTVTMQMQQLEQELGVPLYERVGKQIRITGAGQELLTYAVPIIRMSQEALQVGKGSSRTVEGSLRLGILEVLAGENLARQMNTYLERYPQVELQVQTERDSRVLLEQLRHNEIDFMLTLDFPITDADLVHAGEDKAEQIHFYAGSGHPLERQKNLNLKDILRYPLIRGCGNLSYEKELDKLTGSEELRQIFVQSQDLALRLAVMQGHGGAQAGITLAPDCTARAYKDSLRLTALDYEIPECRVWRQTLCHRNKWQTKAMNAWIVTAEDNR